MADAALGRVHPGAAHLLERDLLADHHLGHPRRAEVHRGVAVAHDHDVAERGDVGAAGRARAEQHAHLRHHARQSHLVEEDPPGVATTGEHLHLLVDPCPGGVDQVHQRGAQRHRALLHAEDLLDRARRPRAGLDGRVVGHHRHRAAADRAGPGHDPLGAEPVLVPAGEQALLGERARVQQPRDALAHRQFALLGRLYTVALGAAGNRAAGGLVQGVAVFQIGHASSSSRNWIVSATGVVGRGGAGVVGRSPSASPAPPATSRNSGQPTIEPAPEGEKAASWMNASTTTTPMYAGPGSRSDAGVGDQSESDRQDPQLPAERGAAAADADHGAAQARDDRGDRALEHQASSASVSVATPAALISATA